MATTMIQTIPANELEGLLHDGLKLVAQSRELENKLNGVYADLAAIMMRFQGDRNQEAAAMLKTLSSSISWLNGDPMQQAPRYSPNTLDETPEPAGTVVGLE